MINTSFLVIIITDLTKRIIIRFEESIPDKKNYNLNPKIKVIGNSCGFLMDNLKKIS